MNEEECFNVRQTIGDRTECTPEQLLSAEQHFRACPSCEAWRNQVNVVTEMAAHLPTYDVPEALTQRIMTDVRESAVNRVFTLRTTVLSCVVVAAAALLFSFESFDTVNGALAWLISFMFLFGLKYMIQANVAVESQLHDRV